MTSGRWDDGALLVCTDTHTNVRRYLARCPYCRNKVFVVTEPGRNIRGHHICQNCQQVYAFFFDTVKGYVATGELSV